MVSNTDIFFAINTVIYIFIILYFKGAMLVHTRLKAYLELREFMNFNHLGNQSHSIHDNMLSMTLHIFWSVLLGNIYTKDILRKRVRTSKAVGWTECDRGQRNCSNILLLSQIVKWMSMDKWTQTSLSL